MAPVRGESSPDRWLDSPIGGERILRRWGHRLRSAISRARRTSASRRCATTTRGAHRHHPRRLPRRHRPRLRLARHLRHTARPRHRRTDPRELPRRPTRHPRRVTVANRDRLAHLPHQRQFVNIPRTAHPHSDHARMSVKAGAISAHPTLATRTKTRFEARRVLPHRSAQAGVCRSSVDVPRHGGETVGVSSASASAAPIGHVPRAERRTEGMCS